MFSKYPRPVRLLAALLLSTSVSACNTSSSALDSDVAEEQVTPQSAEETGKAGSAAPGKEEVAAADATAETDTAAAESGSGPKIIRESNSVSQKGTYIRALVNGEPITSYDIQRRAKFRQLRRESANQEATLNELIDESLKMQEARRRGTVASDAQVDDAFVNFAKSNRSSPKRIAADLNRIGVGADHFKEFIRAQISWQRTVGTRARSQMTSKSATEALFELRKAGESKPQVTEYRLQQIVFVIPANRRKELIKARKAEALNFKQSFSGCDNSFELAKNLRDVTVINLGRMLEPEVPDEWREPVAEIAVGQVTSPRETDKGVEVLAVCESRVTNDDRAAQITVQAQSFEDFRTKGSQIGDEFLAELRKNATVVYR